jgi:D-alanyl-D-alanine carboxypeptidase/D-alanyl-D-alanine-endopeptidase (penicillin-binding protein 4)
VRRILGGLAVPGVLVLAVGGYLTADVHDLVPGLLTLDRTPTTAGMPAPSTVTQGTPGASPSAAVTGVPVPSAEASAAAPLLVATDMAPLPTRAGLSAALAAALADPGLGTSVGLTVRDGRTGVNLLDVSAQVPRIPASTAKLLTATAIMSALGPARTFSTRAVRGVSAGRVGHIADVILVAGGDTLLSPGRGNPAAVAGRAGLADLAGQTAKSLKGQDVTRVRLHIDDRYAKGARYAPGWFPADIDAGLTGPVAMLGLSTQRPAPGRAASTDPALSAARAFSKALGARGITVAPAIDRVASPKTAPDLGVVQSAPTADVLALALQDSDNALTESLARQAAVRAGRPTSFPAVAAWVKETVASRRVAVEGVTLTDTSGLSAGTFIPVRTLGDVLTLAAGGQDRALQDVVARLPVAGLTGTLADRFGKGPAHSAAGIARAKTGTLTGTAALAGTVVDKDGRLLTFAILADKVPPGVGTLTARAALDRFVATLAACGCG